MGLSNRNQFLEHPHRNTANSKVATKNEVIGILPTLYREQLTSSVNQKMIIQLYFAIW